jgi:hypothetical protein
MHRGILRIGFSYFCAYRANCGVHRAGNCSVTEFGDLDCDFDSGFDKVYKCGYHAFRISTASDISEQRL